MGPEHPPRLSNSPKEMLVLPHVAHPFTKAQERIEKNTPSVKSLGSARLAV